MPRISCQKLAVRGEQQVTKPFVLPNPQISIQENIQFLKKLSLVALSSISYIRNIFPEDAFNKRKLDGMSVFIIRQIDECPGTRQMMEWIRSAFQVIEAKCLKKLILVIENPENNTPIETYSMNFTYNREAINYALINETDGLNEVMSQSTVGCPADIKVAVSQLIRSLVMVVQGMAPLPDESDVSMLLEFCDRLPVDFEIPEHFNKVDSLGIDFPPSIQHYKLGKVGAKYISLGVTAKSLLCHDAQVNMEEESGNDSNIENREDEDIVPLSPENTCISGSASSLRFRNKLIATRESLINQTASLIDHRLSEPTPTKLPEPAVAAAATENEYFQAVPPVVPLEPESTDLLESMSCINIKEVDCICMFEDREIDSLKCSVCGTIQHKACYKVLDGESVEQHVCVRCHKTDRPCTAPDLIYMDEKRRKSGAMMRRALNLCLGTARVSINTFTTGLPFPRTLAEKIFNYLASEGCLTGKRNIRAVNVDYIKGHLIPKHFTVPHHHKDDSMNTEENPQFTKENSVALSNKRGRMDDGDLSPNHIGSRLNNKKLKTYAKSSKSLPTV